VSDLEPGDLVALWARVDGELRTALAALDVSDEVKGWVLEFLDANELGVAFQTLVEALVMGSAEVSDQALDGLARVSRDVGLEDDPAWLRLSEQRTRGDDP
jgi:hypothetical protein